MDTKFSKKVTTYNFVVQITTLICAVIFIILDFLALPSLFSDPLSEIELNNSAVGSAVTGVVIICLIIAAGIAIIYMALDVTSIIRTRKAIRNQDIKKYRIGILFELVPITCLCFGLINIFTTAQMFYFVFTYVLIIVAILQAYLTFSKALLGKTPTPTQDQEQEQEEDIENNPEENHL